MNSSTFTLDTVDDVPVHVHRWLPDGDVVGVVQIAHGIAEHAGRYEHVAQRLTDHGWAVYADDHRGHGQSAVSDEELGVYRHEDGWAHVFDDVHRLNLVAREAHPDVPIVMFGHSGGSVLAQEYLFTHGDAIDGAVLSGVPSAPGLLGQVMVLAARAERVRLGLSGRSDLLQKMAFGQYNKGFDDPRTDFDWLSSDPEVVDAYINDPTCGFVYPTQLWIDVLTGLGRAEQPSRRATIRNDIPVYLLAGTMDPAAAQGESVRKLAAAYTTAGLQDVTLRLYDQGRHEMFNEVNRDEVMDELLEWLDAHVLDGAAGSST